MFQIQDAWIKQGGEKEVEDETCFNGFVVNLFYFNK